MEQQSTNNERILYINRDLDRASFTKLMLEKIGYEVVTSTSSFEAIKLFQSQPGKFNLVMSDILMPDMTGMELSNILLKIRSDIPIILCTYLGELVIEKISKEIQIKEFIKNPSFEKELANTVRKVLDKER